MTLWLQKGGTTQCGATALNHVAKSGPRPWRRSRSPIRRGSGAPDAAAPARAAPLLMSTAGHTFRPTRTAVGARHCQQSVFVAKVPLPCLCHSFANPLTFCVLRHSPRRQAVRVKAHIRATQVTVSKTFSKNIWMQLVIGATVHRCKEKYSGHDRKILRLFGEARTITINSLKILLRAAAVVAPPRVVAPMGTQTCRHNEAVGPSVPVGGRQAEFIAFIHVAPDIAVAQVDAEACDAVSANAAGGR